MNGVLGKYSYGVICTYAPGANKPVDMSSAACIVCIHRFSPLLYNVYPLDLDYSGWTFNNEISFGEPLRYSTTDRSIQQSLS